MAQRKILRSPHLNAPFLHFCHLSNSNRIHTKESQKEKYTHNGRKKRRQMREITMWWLSWFWRRVTQVINSVEVSAFIYYMKQYLLFSLLHLQTLGSVVLDVSLSVYYLLLSISITNFMNNLNLNCPLNHEQSQPWTQPWTISTMNNLNHEQSQPWTISTALTIELL